MADVLVRPDLLAAHLRSLEHVARPGSWWMGAAWSLLIVDIRAFADCRGVEGGSPC